MISFYVILFGFFAENLVFWLELFAWAGLGASIGLPQSWHFTGSVLHAPEFFAGLITGTAATIIWHYTPVLRESLYELIPGFTAALIAALLVSLFTLTAHDTQ